MDAYEGAGTVVYEIWVPVAPLKARAGMPCFETAAVAAPTVPETRTERGPRFAGVGKRGILC